MNKRHGGENNFLFEKKFFKSSCFSGLKKKECCNFIMQPDLLNFMKFQFIFVISPSFGL